MRRIVLLGSTGSIGTQTLDVVRSRRDQFGVVALAASGRNTGLLAEQVAAFLPARVAVADSEAIPALRHELAVRGVKMPQLLTGPEAAAELASSDCDVVLNAITGAAGLEPTLAALRAGRTLALANKESLVIGGRLVTDLAAPGQLVAVAARRAFPGGRQTHPDRLGRAVPGTCPW